MFGNDKPTRLILVRPGATDLDDQGRIKGCLDMPLSETGWIQSETIAMELAGESIDELYCGPTQAALETADAILEGRSGTRKRVLDCLQNVDQGLWHGKLIDEVRRQLPK
ncbi:MAG: histidine phosphatase family protein, partial [Planctomycetota bacterium]